MRSKGTDTKRVLYITLSIALVLAGCAKPKQATLTAEDFSVLENSTFNPGEKVGIENPDEAVAMNVESEEVMASRNATDGGFIGKPGSTSGGSDTGSIAKPGSSTPSAPAPTPAPVVVAPSPTPSAPVQDTTNVASSGGTSSSSTPSSSSGSSTASPSGPASTSTSTQSAGTDSGYIGQPASQSADGGSYVPGSSTTSGSGTVVSGGSSAQSGSSSSTGTSTGFTPVADNSSASGATSNDSSSQSSSSGSSSSSSSIQPAGSDGGYIGQSGSTSNDGGSVGPGAGSVTPDNGGSSSSGGTVVASNGSSSAGGSSSSGSTVSTGSSSNPDSSTSGSSSSGSSTQPAGSDGGYIGQSGSTSNDGGSVGPGAGSVTPDNGSSSASTGGSVASTTGSNPSPTPAPTVNAGGSTVSDIIQQVIDSVTGTSSQPTPTGNDGGSIPQNGSTSNDGGSVTSGGSVSPDQGNSGGTSGGSVTQNPGTSGNTPAPTPAPTVNAGGNTIAQIIQQIINTVIEVVSSWIPSIDGGQVAQNGNSNPDHGNNGVGNGLDPQPPGNPAVNDGPGTSPGNPGNQGGSCSCSNHTTPKPSPKPVVVAPTPTPKPVVNDTTVKVSVWRACSDKRSKVKAPRFVFFEESKHPILSMEAMSQDTYYDCQETIDKIANLYFDIPGTYCGSKAPNTTLVMSKDISSFNMIDHKNKVDAGFNLANLKKELGSFWRQKIVAVTVCDDTNGNGKCSDEKPSNILSVLPPSFAMKSIPTKLEIDVWSGRNLSQDENPESCDMQYSPLLLDLTGEGFKLSGPENGVYFDLNATGEPVATGWTDANNIAFLVRDLDKDRGIASGAELFGNATMLKNGERAANGFEALKDLDNNQDMLFSNADVAWRSVRLWIDKNQNGISERKEIYSLDEHHIESINLNYKNVFEVDQYGNATKQRSVFTKKKTLLANPQIFQIIDVWFQTINRQ